MSRKRTTYSTELKTKLVLEVLEGEKTINESVSELHVSASIRVTFYPQKEKLEADALLSQADKAMYNAKESGKNQFSFFKP